MKGDITTPKEITETFVERLKVYLEAGLPKKTCELSASVDVVNLWLGDIEDPFELDKSTRIVMAIVDAYIWMKN
jgi:hypothetical protein